MAPYLPLKGRGFSFTHMKHSLLFYDKKSLCFSPTTSVPTHNFLPAGKEKEAKFKDLVDLTIPGNKSKLSFVHEPICALLIH